MKIYINKNNYTNSYLVPTHVEKLNLNRCLEKHLSLPFLITDFSNSNSLKSTNNNKFIESEYILLDKNIIKNLIPDYQNKDDENKIVKKIEHIIFFINFYLPNSYFIIGDLLEEKEQNKFCNLLIMFINKFASYVEKFLKETKSYLYYDSIYNTKQRINRIKKKLNINNDKLILLTKKNSKSLLGIKVGYVYEIDKYGIGVFKKNFSIEYNNEKTLYLILFDKVTQDFCSKDFQIEFNNAVQKIKKNNKISENKQLLIVLYPLIINLQKKIINQYQGGENENLF